MFGSRRSAKEVPVPVPAGFPAFAVPPTEGPCRPEVGVFIFSLVLDVTVQDSAAAARRIGTVPAASLRYVLFHTFDQGQMAIKALMAGEDHAVRLLDRMLTRFPEDSLHHATLQILQAAVVGNAPVVTASIMQAPDDALLPLLGSAATAVATAMRLLADILKEDPRVLLEAVLAGKQAAVVA